MMKQWRSERGMQLPVNALGLNKPIALQEGLADGGQTAGLMLASF